MPLSTDPSASQAGENILHTMKDIFHPPPGIRPGNSTPRPPISPSPHPTLPPPSVHAKGLLLTGTFTPTPAASLLSRAPHFTLPSVPLLARFSSSTGIPHLPDPDPNGNPRGLALRFHLPPDPSTGRRVHTDIITHSVDAFPGRDGPETSAFFAAVKEGRVAEFLADPANESARRFVAAPKPTPAGLERGEYFAVSAFVLVDGAGGRTKVRYRVVPAKGKASLSDEEAAGRGPDFLYEGLEGRVKGGEPVGFKLVVQVGEEGDVTGDNTVKWPEERKLVELGEIKLDKVVEDDPVGMAKKIIFDPIPRVDGVEPSDDPLLEIRAHAYLLSGRERRAA